MFKSGRYSQASVAFRRAGNDRLAKISDAFALHEKAKLISTTANAARTQAFITAADALLACARDSPTERTTERKSCYAAAGECFSEVRDLKGAGDSYIMAGKYESAAHSYREGGYVDDMTEVIIRHKDALESDFYLEMMAFARIHYFKVYSSAGLSIKHV